MLAMTGERYEECVPGCNARYLGEPARTRRGDDTPAAAR